jgi:hypothetical protein
MAVTEVGMDVVSSLCSSQHPSNVLTGLWTRLLREHFANPTNLQFNGMDETTVEGKPTLQLQRYTWSEDNTKTMIQIQPVWEYNPQDIQRRPALYIKRNAVKFERLGLDDGFTAGSDKNARGQVIRVPGEYHSKMMLGSHTVFCVGQTGAETELLAQEVTNHIMMFGPRLRAEFKLTRLTLTEVGELALLDEFVEHFVVPVVIGYGIAMSWRIVEIQPFLKTLSINVSPAP